MAGMPEAALSEMQKGSALLYFGAGREPKYKHVQLSADLKVLEVRSARRNASSVEVHVMSMDIVEEGQRSETFRANPRPHVEALSFSVHYVTLQDARSLLTLDFACRDAHEYDAWMDGLRFLIRHKRNLNNLLQAKHLKIVESAMSDELLGGGTVASQTGSQAGGSGSERQRDLYSWGKGAWGQLGHSDKLEGAVDTTKPRGVQLPTHVPCSVEFMACGDNHSACISTTGTVYTWGHGGSGRLGHGDQEHEAALYVAQRGASEDAEPAFVARARQGILATEHVLVPRPVAALSHVRMTGAACGAAHSLFCSDCGVLYSCGANVFGQLGTGDAIDRVAPVAVRIQTRGLALAGPPRAVALACGLHASAAIVEADVYHDDHSAAAFRRRFLFTFGSGNKGALGHGCARDEARPRLVRSLARKWNAESVAAGVQHFAVMADLVPGAELMEDDEEGEEGALIAPISRQSVRGARRRGMQGVGNGRGCLLTWGWGACGQLGHGDFLDKDRPALVTRLRDLEVTHMDCGALHTACVGHVSRSHTMVKRFGDVGGVQASRRQRQGRDNEAAKSSSQLFAWGRQAAFAGAAPDAAAAAEGAMQGNRAAMPATLHMPPMPSSPTSVAGAAHAGSTYFRSVACGKDFTIALTRSGHVVHFGRGGGDAGGAFVHAEAKEIKRIAAGGGHAAYTVLRDYGEAGARDNARRRR